MKCALKPDSTLPLFRDRASDIYHSLAQNFITADFVGLGEPQGEETFKLVEHLLLKSLFYKKDSRVYYNLASHYYNHAVYMINGMKIDDITIQEIEAIQERAKQLILESQEYFKKACAMEERYCKFVIKK
jgi:hypothetical protein